MKQAKKYLTIEVTESTRDALNIILSVRKLTQPEWLERVVWLEINDLGLKPTIKKVRKDGLESE